MSNADMTTYEAAWQAAQRALDRLAELTDLTSREEVLIQVARESNTQIREVTHTALGLIKERDRARESLARIKRKHRA